MSIEPIILANIGTGEGDNREPVRIRPGHPRPISTVPGERDGSREEDPVTPEYQWPEYQVLFEDNFDEQPDYTSAMHSDVGTQLAPDGFTVPNGWYGIRQDPSWAPSEGHEDRHESIEILAANSDKARGGTGKSYVSWRDSYDPGWNRWNSESILAKFFETGMTEMYVRFWIRFSPVWTPAGTSKLFRISSWDGPPSSIFSYANSGNNSPVMFWDYSGSDENTRNRISMRGDPRATNYFLTQPPPDDLPRSPNSGDMSLNFDNDIRIDGLGLDGDPVSLIDKSTGNVVAGLVSHDGLWGRTENFWNKIEFYVRMNSAPGVKDGAWMEWINDQMVFRNETMPWMGTDSAGGRKWNVVAIGGNDFFREYPNEDRHEEWYSIDDFLVASTLPVEKRP